jgi:hypothetical protein
MDNRRSTRSRTRTPGVLSFAGGGVPVSCAVRDLSEVGARLAVLRPAEIPDRFTLRLVESGETCDAEVRWRRGREVGVEFMSRDDGLEIGWRAPEEGAAPG